MSLIRDKAAQIYGMLGAAEAAGPYPLPPSPPSRGSPLSSSPMVFTKVPAGVTPAPTTTPSGASPLLPSLLLGVLLGLALLWVLWGALRFFRPVGREEDSIASELGVVTRM